MEEKDLKKIEDALGQFSKSIDKKLDDYNKEAQKANHEGMEQVKASLEKEVAEWKRLHEEKANLLQKQIDALETKANRIEVKDKRGPLSMKEAVGDVISNLTKDGNLRDILRSKRRTGELELKTVEDMTQSNTLTSVLEPMRVPGFIWNPETRFRVRDLVSPGTTTAASVTAVYESSIDDSTDVTAEGLEYKQSAFDLAIYTYTVRKITAYIILSEELLEDVEGLSSYISVRLPEKLRVKENQQLLYGSGGGVQLSGLTTNATAYSDNLADSDISRIDILVDAFRQVRDDEYEPTFALIHPTDATNIKLTKDDNGNYIHPWIFMGNGQITLDGVPVYVSTAITSGQFLVGDGKLGAQVFDRRQATLEMSFENEDNFIKGMVTVRIAERLTLATYRAKAFIYGSFAAALAQGSA